MINYFLKYNYRMGKKRRRFGIQMRILTFGGHDSKCDQGNNKNILKGRGINLRKEFMMV